MNEPYWNPRDRPLLNAWIVPGLPGTTRNQHPTSAKGHRLRIGKLTRFSMENRGGYGKSVVTNAEGIQWMNVSCCWLKVFFNPKPNLQHHVWDLVCQTHDPDLSEQEIQTGCKWCQESLSATYTLPCTCKELMFWSPVSLSPWFGIHLKMLVSCPVATISMVYSSQRLVFECENNNLVLDSDKRMPWSLLDCFVMTCSMMTCLITTIHINELYSSFQNSRSLLSPCDSIPGRVTSSSFALIPSVRPL